MPPDIKISIIKNAFYLWGIPFALMGVFAILYDLNTYKLVSFVVVYISAMISYCANGADIRFPNKG